MTRRWFTDSLAASDRIARHTRVSRLRFNKVQSKVQDDGAGK